jgi:hypothetical protein
VSVFPPDRAPERFAGRAQLHLQRMYRPGQFLGRYLVHRPLALNPSLPIEARRCHAQTKMAFAPIAPSAMATMALAVVDQFEICRFEGFFQLFSHLFGHTHPNFLLVKLSNSTGLGLLLPTRATI